MKYNGVIVYFETDPGNEQDIREMKFDCVSIEDFEIMYGNLDTSNIIRIELNLM